MVEFNELFFRLIGLAIGLSFFPGKFLGFLARFVVFCALLFIFGAQVFTSGKTLGENGLVVHSLAGAFATPRGISTLFPNMTWSIGVTELLLGLLLGISASVGIYLAECLASWFNALLDRQQVANVYPEAIDERLTMLFRIFVAVLFYQIGIFAGLIELFSSSLTLLSSDVMSIAANTVTADNVSHVLSIVFTISRVVLGTAFIIAIPILAVFAILHFALFVFERYARPLMHLSFSHSIIFPVMILAISLSFYQFSDRINDVIFTSIGSSNGKHIIDTVRSTFFVR